MKVYSSIASKLVILICACRSTNTVPAHAEAADEGSQDLKNEESVGSGGILATDYTILILLAPDCSIVGCLQNREYTKRTRAKRMIRYSLLQNFA